MRIRNGMKGNTSGSSGNATILTATFANEWAPTFKFCRPAKGGINSASPLAAHRWDHTAHKSVRESSCSATLNKNHLHFAPFRKRLGNSFVSIFASSLLLPHRAAPSFCHSISSLRTPAAYNLHPPFLLSSQITFSRLFCFGYVCGPLDLVKLFVMPFCLLEMHLSLKAVGH